MVFKNFIMDTDSLKLEKIIFFQKENNSELKSLDKSLKKSINLIENNLQSTAQYYSDQSEICIQQNEQLKLLTTEIKVINENLEKLQADKLLGKIGYDTLFAVSAILFVFIVGFLIDRIVKKVIRNIKERKIRKYFCNNVVKFSNNLLTPLRKAYRDFYLEHDIDTGIPLNPPKVLTGEMAKISELDFKDIMESFDYDENIYKTQQFVEFTGGIIGDAEKYHDIVLYKSNVKRENLQKMLEDYIKLMAIFLEDEQRRNREYESFDLWNLINDKLSYFHTSESAQKRLSVFYQKILKPIQDLLVTKKYFRKYRLVGEIAEKGRILSDRFYELRYLTTEIRSEYKKFYHSLDNISIKISTMIEKFNKNNWL